MTRYGLLSGETECSILVFSKKQNPYGGVKDQEFVNTAVRSTERTGFGR